MDVPHSWKCESLGTLATQITKGTTPTTAGFQYQSDGIPFIKVENIINGRVSVNSVSQFISEEAHSSLKRSQFQKGDVLFSIAGTIGKTALVGGADIPANTNQAVAIIRGVEGSFIPDFLKLHLQEAARRIRAEHARGGAMNNVSLSDLKDITVSLPPLAEQKAIAEKLDTLLAQVESTKARLERIPKILKRFRQSVLAAAVSGKLTEGWRDNHEKDFSEWNLLTVGDVATVATGKTPSRKEPGYWNDGDIPWLTSASTGDIYTRLANQFVTKRAVEECSLKLFEPGALLLAMYGEGKTRGQVTELMISATCNQACAAVIANEEKTIRSYLKLRLLENYEETRKAAAGGAQPNLNLNKVRAIEINVPSIQEQTEIVRRVDQLFTYADTIETQVNNAQERVNNLTQSILAKAFRGELTEQWRKDNPDLISGENSASALLEKIKAERAAVKPAKRGRKKEK